MKPTGIDYKKNKIIEVGYDYLDYRKFVHPLGLKFLILIFFAVIVIIVGFPIFFSRALVQPLNSLLSGVNQVNNGDLDVVLPIYVEDEVGYLSRSFNGMVHSIKDSKQKLQEYAETLEDKVKERTAELQKAFEEVNALKKQQDGDYFLTSLLTHPLGSNKAQSPNLNVDVLLEQKKKFEFRKWARDIGGDTCITSSVTLKGKPHTVFLNADAMGKSMQGAGGALVLGAVFYSIVERTRSVPTMQQLAPERWLKNAFLELDKVFESFDGSMLVSLVLGLVDTQTGLLYYVNAEHPWSILYRDGNARFIENELALRKLGMYADGRISVRVFEMQPGDALICGSDGRDDILLHTPDGRPKMNENEDLILSAIRDAQGDIRRVYDISAQRGEITDDYSLLKISYFGDAMPESEKKAMRSASGAYYRAQNYLKAIAEGEKYLNQRPADTEFMRFLSRCHRLAGNYEIAIDLAERLRLRMPEDIRNLTNLAAMHGFRGSLERAGQILAEIRALDAGNASIKKLEDLLQRRAQKR